MLDAAREALSFAEGRSRLDLSHDRMLALSLTAEIQIIGESGIESVSGDQTVGQFYSLERNQ
jgi:uncharacterized protein with HEPN domain